MWPKSVVLDLGSRWTDAIRRADRGVGFSKLKDCIRLLFWSGQSFEEDDLKPEGKFKAAEKRFTDKRQIDTNALQRWLGKARDIQWDYKNIVKRKGRLGRLR